MQPDVTALRFLGHHLETFPGVYCAEVENALAADLADLDKFLTERLPRYRHPKALEIVDALPATPPAKCSRRNYGPDYALQNLLTPTKDPLRQRFLRERGTANQGGHVC